MTAFLNEFKSGPSLINEDPNYVENLVKFGSTSIGNVGAAAVRIK